MGSTPKRFGFGQNDVNERMVPEEYIYNSSMINELIKQNKDLHKQLTQKQEEIDRLNVLIGSFRAKLIKYTELNKKMQQQQQQQQQDIRYSNNIPSYKSDSPHFSSPQDHQGSQAEHIQVKKNNRTEESKIDDIYEKLELLTKLVNEAVQKQHDGSRSGFSKQDIKIVNDDDIIVSESQEFKHLQDQIDILKRKLLIKKENELRKLSLNKELIDLMEELNMNSSNTPNPLSRSTSEHHSEHYNHHKSNQQGYHNENSHPLHCEHCHVKSHSENHPPEPKFVNLKESLETPTPTPTQTPRKLRKENDNSVANKQYSLW